MKAILPLALVLNLGIAAFAQTPFNQQTEISLSCDPQEILVRQNERLKVLVQARSIFADGYRKFVLKRDQLHGLKDEIAQRGKVSSFFRGLKNPRYRKSEIQRLERELDRDAMALKDADVLIQLESQQIDLQYKRDKLRCLVENAPNQ